MLLLYLRQFIHELSWQQLLHCKVLLDVLVLSVLVQDVVQVRQVLLLSLLRYFHSLYVVACFILSLTDQMLQQRQLLHFFLLHELQVLHDLAAELLLALQLFLGFVQE